MHKAPLTRPDPWGFLAKFTSARIALGRAGGSVPTTPLLAFQLAHARARDAVLQDLDVALLSHQLHNEAWPPLLLDSAASDRTAYIQRPDLGQILSPDSTASLTSWSQDKPPCDVVFVIADGLSASAVQHHSLPMLRLMLPTLRAAGWSVAPPCIVRHGRVAVADEIGALLGASMSVMLIGERPGLSSPDTLGIYLTWQPSPGKSNADRNCLSNVRPEGLSYDAAAHKLQYLMMASRDRRLSGVNLKEDAAELITGHAVREIESGDNP